MAVAEVYLPLWLDSDGRDSTSVGVSRADALDESRLYEIARGTCVSWSRKRCRRWARATVARNREAAGE